MPDGVEGKWRLGDAGAVGRMVVLSTQSGWCADFGYCCREDTAPRTRARARARWSVRVRIMMVASAHLGSTSISPRT